VDGLANLKLKIQAHIFKSDFTIGGVNFTSGKKPYSTGLKK
jgi:hypothetical protein